MNRPKVSVLIPCYNAEKYLGETLESVFSQTWPNQEVILVDDGSKDASIKVAQAFKNAGLMIITQKNAGASLARNRAFAACSGDFIQFLDADDLLDREKIEIQLGRLLGSIDCVASAEWARFYQDSSEIGFDESDVHVDLDPLEWIARDGLRMMFPAMWLIPRKIAEAAGPWDQSLSLADDTEYFSRVLLASRKVLFCRGARCYYRSRVSGSLSGRKSPAAWESQSRALELCEGRIRALEDSVRVRTLFAIQWQIHAHGAYPYHPTLANRALARAKALHPVQISPGGGPMFSLISRLLGWKLARRIQVATGRS